jgi:hypothetical protein
MSEVTHFEAETRTDLFVGCPSCGRFLFYLIRSEPHVFILLCDGCGSEFILKISDSGSVLLVPLEGYEDQSCLKH